MKKQGLILFFLLLFSFSYSQQGGGGRPLGFKYFSTHQQTIPSIIFDRPNVKALRKEDRINDSLKRGPWRFGYNNSTNLNLYNSGVWHTTANGDKIWLLKIQSKDAKTINLTFENTYIPEGNKLYIYNPEGSFILGKFTQKHIYKGELGSELIQGNTVIVEYDVAAENLNNLGSIDITTVTHGYRTSEEYYNKTFGGSGNCEINVNCPEGAPYQNQRNSVVMLVVGSSGFCSGALINNTNFDGTPYVLTANHCYSYNNNLASWVFRFNWQSTGCTNPPSSPPFQSLSGSALRARGSDYDFCLVEIKGGLLNGTVPPSYHPYFSGWDHGDVVPNSTFCIHHPSGDIKKISIDNNAPLRADYPLSSHQPNNSWIVSWDKNTATEGGSSGSPLFNQKGQIIGQLWGGNSTCAGAGSGQDYYGRFCESWNPPASLTSGQLKHWLDPIKSKDTAIMGYDPSANPMQYNVALISFNNYSKYKCSPSFLPQIQIQNLGTKTLTSLKVIYTYNGGSSQDFIWSGSLQQYSTVSFELPVFNMQKNQNTIAIQLQQPNGKTDEYLGNNSLDTTFTAKPNGTQLDFTFYMGCFSDENSWKLTDTNGSIIYSGDNYPSPMNVNHLASQEFCLNDGCYQLTLIDDFGDGVKGASYTGCNYSGSMSLIQASNNDTLAYLSIDSADFGYEKTFSFCIENASLKTDEIHKIVIYPNPASKTLFVDIDLKGTKEIKMFSLLGQNVYHREITNKKLKINTQNFAAGVYILTVITRHKKIVQKIIIE